MSELLNCPFCGGEATKQFGFNASQNLKGRIVCSCGAEIRQGRNATEQEIIEKWNTRAAVTDHDFAMAANDGELWGKCSECKERQGYYLDAETIQRQQKRIAELFAEINEEAAGRIERDELIRDLWEYMTGGTGYCLTCALCGNCYLDVYGDDCGMRNVFAGRMRELGIEVD